MNQYVEAGVRVIFKRALAELGIRAGTEKWTTPELIVRAVEWNAPVIFMSRRWLIMANGKPDLSLNERKLMEAQAIHARLMWMKAKQEVRRRNAEN